MKNASLTRAQVYQVDDPCYDIGRGVPPIGIKVKDPMCGISRAIQMVSFQHIRWCPQKMQYSSVNHLSLVPPFVSSDAHLLWKLMTKGERLVQRYEICKRH